MGRFSRTFQGRGSRSHRLTVVGRAAVVAALAAVGSDSVNTPADATAPLAIPRTPPLATSVLSPRRLPDWLVTSVARSRLASSVRSVLTTSALGSAASSTCALVTQGSAVITSVGPRAELLPASNLKLLTATAALDKLGPNFVYTTGVRAEAAPVGGVVNGNLYLVGSGDPVLRTEPYVSSLEYPEPDYTSLAQLAQQVVAAGVHEVTGSVVGDEGLFDTARAIPTWKPIYTAEGDVGPLSALDVNDGFVLTADSYIAATQPAESAADQFATLLAADGVTFTAAKPPPATPLAGMAAPSTPAANPGLPALAGATPPSAVPITSISSPPLSNIVGTILRASDDTGAELLTKELGARFGGAGTTAAGLTVIRADLAARGLPVSQLQAVDGSGLDRSDRVTCQLILDDLISEGPSSAFAAGLPVSGKTGTLDDRMTSPATVGRILAKTGTLDDVAALSGFVLPRPGTPPAPPLASDLEFSLIMNGLSNPDVGVTVGNNLATVLAAYPDVPSAARVGPTMTRTEMTKSLGQ
jgi:serine-type D-Ala-D-Ala carboxypeptidase/endopeptidase (penicillin-binding protein 4)